MLSPEGEEVEPLSRVRREWHEKADPVLALELLVTCALTSLDGALSKAVTHITALLQQLNSRKVCTLVPPQVRERLVVDTLRLVIRLAEMFPSAPLCAESILNLLTSMSCLGRDLLLEQGTRVALGLLVYLRELQLQTSQGNDGGENHTRNG